MRGCRVALGNKWEWLSFKLWVFCHVENRLLWSSLTWLWWCAVISLLSWSWTWKWVQKGKRIVLARLERSGIVFSTALASGNGGGCIGCSGLCDVMMSCNYMSCMGWGKGSLEVACWWCASVSLGVGMSRLMNQYEGVLGFFEWKWMCQDPRMTWLRGFEHLQTISRFLKTVGTLALEHVTLFFFLSNLVVQKCSRGFRPFHDLVLVNLWGEWGNGLPYFLYSLVQMTRNCSIVCYNQIGYL